MLCGDYNAVPTPLDAYKPERWVDDAVFFPETREALCQAGRAGLDGRAARDCIPVKSIYTYWDYFRNAFGRNAGLRMDHLLLSPALAKRLVAAGVDREVRGWEKTSDHAPVWIELKDGPASRARKKSAGVMARKLKTYQTSIGFYDLAIAAPSMKAALEAWGTRTNFSIRDWPGNPTTRPS